MQRLAIDFVGKAGFIILLLGVITPAALYGQKVAIGKYLTKETPDKAFVAALRTLPSVKFTVRSSDKNQGTIQANQMARGREYASLFLMINKEGNDTMIEATFSIGSGSLGSPMGMAQKFGQALKSEMPDITINVNKK